MVTDECNLNLDTTTFRMWPRSKYYECSGFRIKQMTFQDCLTESMKIKEIGDTV